MAQAARLSLRMQKELKLLLSDPPPGASLPLLSSDSDLSSIDADIEGPDGTVYAKGFFRIKIQIPERYPFQPPNVTFVTPIYHPNIDNAGRICLDILNLPPKGSWQPSLNISTVLTSIGLLLSEPNPDDGLMWEASREYKYNRQVFNQKARSMTEKYAMAGASGSTSSDPCVQLRSNPSTMEGAELLNEARDEKKEVKSVQKKFWGMSRKLSLDSSTSIRKGDDNAYTEEMSNPHSFAFGCEGNLSIEGTKGEKRADEDANTHGRLETKLLSIDTHHNAVSNSNPKVDKSDAFDIRCEKVGFSSRPRKLSLGKKGPSKKMEMDNKENIFPVESVQFSRAVNASAGCGITEKILVSPPSDLPELSRNKNQLSHSTEGSKDMLMSEGIDLHVPEETPATDMVIVLDSEDSEDEERRCPRREGMLGRKRLKNWSSNVCKGSS